MAPENGSTPSQLGSTVSVQAGIQKVLRPAARVPFLRLPHGWREEWAIESSAATFVQRLAEGLPRLSDSPEAGGFVYTLDHASANPTQGTATASISVLTKVRWLDCAELKLKDVGEDKCTATVRYFSTGLLPLTVPGAVVLNTAFCFFPFSHGGLPSGKSLPDIRRAAGVPVSVGKAGLVV